MLQLNKIHLKVSVMPWVCLCELKRNQTYEFCSDSIYSQKRLYIIKKKKERNKEGGFTNPGLLIF